MPNINALTGIPYGYIAAAALDPEIVDELLYGRGAIDLSYQAALDEADGRASTEVAELGFDHGAPDWERFCARRTCVPGAAILDTLDGSEFGYDVPADWRAHV